MFDQNQCGHLRLLTFQAQLFIYDNLTSHTWWDFVCSVFQLDLIVNTRLKALMLMNASNQILMTNMINIIKRFQSLITRFICQSV